jgi:hypothetical protein
MKANLLSDALKSLRERAEELHAKPKESLTTAELLYLLDINSIEIQLHREFITNIY